MVINNTAPWGHAQICWSRPSSAINKLKCQAKSAHHILIKVQHILEKKAPQPQSVLCRPASVLVFKALVAEDTLQIALHLISSLSLRYLPRHQRAANGRWAGATRTQTRETLPKSCSDNMILSLSSSFVYLSLAVAYRWGHKLIIGMSSVHSDT